MEVIKQMTTEAQKAANKKYVNTKERVNCNFPPGTKEKIKMIGYESIQKFIIAAVNEKIEKEMKYIK